MAQYLLLLAMFIVSIPTIARWPAWRHWLHDLTHEVGGASYIGILFNIFGGIVHELDLEKGPRSNVNMPMEMPYATFYLLLAIAMFALTVTICEKFVIEMCITLTLTFRMGHGQM